MLSTKLILGSVGLLAATSLAVVLPVSANKLPRNGTVLKMTNGDVACYIDLRDVAGRKHTLTADFSLCETPSKYLNRRVKLTYERAKVSNCQSAEPCGKTRWENLVVRLKLPQ
jgi:hypothetical protein